MYKNPIPPQHLTAPPSFPLFDQGGMSKRLIGVAALIAACSSVTAWGGGMQIAHNDLAYQESGSPWYIGARVIVGATYENTSFLTLSSGASDAEEDSYDPQENWGA